MEIPSRRREAPRASTPKRRDVKKQSRSWESGKAGTDMGREQSHRNI